LNNRKNQNSILVLATLGVYLGLVLAGATPQVLANAAMTRQFDVKDEIEVKDDLDKKPNKLGADSEEAPESIATDTKISRSVQKFLAEFKTIDPATSFYELPSLGLEHKVLLSKTRTSFDHDRFDIHIPLDQILALTNLPRAGLDTLLATNAK
jgi:hypothetical protein